MIQLDYRDAKPIYQQIKHGLRHLVMTHAIEPDEKLPSVRELAALLAINPNTIQRAYRELEDEGYLYTCQGKGTFAAHTPVAGKRQQELMRQFDDVVAELLFLSVSSQDLSSRIALLSEGGNSL
ncbi:MAG: GntR family transcriptional regulator [Lachnospiraceae bacterium]|nr:GntR family transcriptional regulator [Lachnospiraceae bacterium]MCI9149699.1 GntR family transcriptional regulator [Lachnospiraceae bacterium]